MISIVKVNAQFRINGRIKYSRPLTKSVCHNLEKKALPQMKIRERKMKMLEALCSRWIPSNLAKLQYHSQSNRPTMIEVCLHLLLALPQISQKCKISRARMSKLRIRVKTIMMTVN